MHIIKLNNYKMDEENNNNTPIKNTCLLHVLLKVYKEKHPHAWTLCTTIDKI